MPYQLSDIYHAIPDGRGGVRLKLKENFQSSVNHTVQRMKIRDGLLSSAVGTVAGGLKTAASGVHALNAGIERNSTDGFLPGKVRSFTKKPTGDDEEVEEEQPNENYQVIATLDPPKEGYRYELVDEGDTISLVLCPDTGEDLNTNDRTFKHRMKDGVDPVLRRMNQINRGYHARTGDATVERRFTLFHHTPLPNEKLILERNEEDGSFNLILVSNVDDFMNPSTAMSDPAPFTQKLDKSDEEDESTEAGFSSTLGKTEYGRSIRDVPQQLAARRQPIRDSARPNALRAQNVRNKEFWTRRK